MVDLAAVCLEVEEVFWYPSMMAGHVMALEIAIVAIPWVVLPRSAGWRDTILDLGWLFLCAEWLGRMSPLCLQTVEWVTDFGLLDRNK